MTWLDFIALVLATGAPINAWLLEQGPLSSIREWLIAWGTVEAPADAENWQPSWEDRFRAAIAELVQCRFCLHYYVPGILLICYAIGVFEEPPWDILWKLPIYALAATRVSYHLSRFWHEEDYDRERPGSS